MAKKYLFSEDRNGSVREIKVDPKHLDKQLREERASGRTPTVLDEDERIDFGLLAKNLRDNR